MVHQYKLGGYNIVLDVFSGAVHAVDEVAYDAIALYETHTKGEIKAELLAKYGERENLSLGELDEVLADIEQLKADGKLFTEDVLCRPRL